VLVIRPIVHQEQDPGAFKTLDYCVKDGLGLGIDPVKILESHAQWLNLTLPEQ
jgi:hypothetical protein